MSRDRETAGTAAVHTCDARGTRSRSAGLTVQLGRNARIARGDLVGAAGAGKPEPGEERGLVVGVLHHRAEILPRLVSAFDDVRSGRAQPTTEDGKSTYRVGEISFLLRAAP